MIDYQKPNKAFQAKNWLINSWKLFKKKPLTWIFMVLIFNIFLIIGSNFVIGRFIVALLLPVLAGGIFIAFDKTNRDEQIGLESLFSVFKDKPILKELLTVGAIGVAIIVLTIALQYLTGTDYEIKLETSKVEGASDVYKQVSKGSAFTGIVSWLWSCALLFGIPMIAINREPAVPALKSSFYGLLINLPSFFVFFGMTILLVIISIIPVGLGLLVLSPVLFGAIYFAFKDIYVEAEAEAKDEAKDEYVSELTAGLGAIAPEITEQEGKSGVYKGNKAQQESDLKEAYRVIRLFRMLALAIIAIGIIIASYTFYSLQVGTNTTGEVLSVETHTSTKSEGGSTTTYKPTFLFTDKLGEQHTAPTSSMSSELNYPVGARVKISYNSSDYSTVQINSIKSILYVPILIWLFGGALLWMAKSAKKNVDVNGVPPRKSVFLKEGSDSHDVIAEPNNSEIKNESEIVQVVSQDKQDSTKKNAEADELVELVLPKKFTLDLYDDYMHITLSWFGKKTFVATLIAVFYIGSSLVFFFSESTTITGSPLMIKLSPWISTILGAGILYYTLTTWLNKTHIFVSQNAIEIKNKPLPSFGNKRLETKNIKQLYSKKEISSSTSNSRTSVSYHLHVISFDEDDMTLLKVENSAQALFLEQEIEKYLGIEDLRVRGEIG
jgi:hypothetical protein